MSRAFLAWHFLQADGRLANGDGRPVVVGETLRVGGPPVLYRVAIDALAAGATTRMEVVAHVARVGVIASREGHGRGTKWRIA